MHDPVRVLIVDDDEDDYVLVRGLLTQTGRQFQVRWTASCDEGLRELRAGGYGVALVDYRLGARTGIDLLREAGGGAGAVPVILLTGQGDHAVDLAAMHAGAADFLVKGRIDPAALERSIRYALERSRAAQALQRQTTLVRLLQEITVTANEASSVEDALRQCLEHVCRHTGWPLGHVLLLFPSGEIVDTDVWFDSGVRDFSRFQPSRERPFLPGPGLAGRVVTAGKPAWIPDVRLDPHFTRAELARECGLGAAFAFPVTVGPEVVAVLEFFALEPLEPDLDLLEVLAHAGAILGRVVERKRSEERLRESEEKYRTLVANLPDLVWTVNELGQTPFMSPNVEAMLGYTADELCAGGREFAVALTHADDREAVAGAFQRLMEDGAPLDVEFRIRRKDGAWTWLNSRASQCYLRGGIRHFDGVSSDITARKAMEEHLRQVLTGVRCLLWHGRVREESGRLRWELVVPNEAAAQQVLPLVVPARQSYADAWRRSRLPQDSRRADALARQALRGGCPGYAQEFRCVGADGRVRWLREDARITPDGPGCWDVVGVCTDVTEQRRAEEGLRYAMGHAQCLLWHAHVEEVPDNTERHRWDTHVFDEEAAQRFLPLEILAGESYVDAWRRSRLPEDRPQMARTTLTALQEGWAQYSQEFRCRRQDGEIRWMYEHVHLEALASGRWRLAGVMTDITDRKRAEEALRRSEVYFRSLIENASDVITVLSEEGTILYQSPSGGRLVGYEPEELVGRSAFELVHPDDRQRLLEALRAGVRAGSLPTDRTEFRLRARDGSWRVLEGIGKFLEMPGERRIVVVNARDVTERKLLEEQLLQSQKMEAVGRLAGGVAHDFNNMLAVISGYSELLLGRVSRFDPIAQPLEEIRKASERAADLTRQLLAFSRKQVLSLRILDLNEVVVGVQQMLGRLIGEDVELRTVMAPLSGRVKADRIQIEQVILNLAVNARDAMPKGGTLTLETRDVELDGKYSRQHQDVKPGRYVMLAVSDTGEGMDAGTLQHIFEPFFTTKAVGQGTGLGLATVYGIVKQSGGHVFPYSEPGIGSTFKVYLPVVAPAVEEPPTPEAGRGPCVGSETVLLVEDEPMVRSFVAEVMSGAGYRVLEAARGEAALCVAAEHPGEIHLLLTDVVMPGMNGPELAKRLRSRRPELRVLFMSGYTDDAVVRHGALPPDTAFIEKPFAPSVLTRKVRELLEARDAAVGGG